jgi:hypothetical protein
MIFRQTVDQIVRKFAKTVTDLENVSAALSVKAEKGKEQAERLHQVAIADNVQAERATRIAERLNSLIEG